MLYALIILLNHDGTTHAYVIESKLQPLECLRMIADNPKASKLLRCEPMKRKAR